MPENMNREGEKARYDLKAAIVVTSQQKNESMIMHLDLLELTIKPYPEMYKIVQEKMKKAFSKVDIVEERKLAKENYDILINALAKIECDGFEFMVTFSAAGIEVRDGTDLFQTTSNKKDRYNPPKKVVTSLLAFLTGGTLFILAPITHPLIASIQGKYSEETISKILLESIDESVDSLLANPMLKMYAEGAETIFVNEAKRYREMPVKPALPEKVQQYRVAAEDAFNNKDFVKALEYYRKGLAVESLWPQGQFDAAMLAGELHQYEEAALYMKHYLELVPDAADAKAARENIYLWEGKAKEKIQ
jgi:hypothetical protein